MTQTKILVIDDSNLIVKLVKKALLKNGVDGCNFIESSILTAENGLDAFGTFGKHSDIEFVVTDVNMPDLNGDELIEVLEDTGKLKDTKVIFITTQSISKDIKRSSLKRSLGVIHKPFNDISFNKKFNELLIKKANELANRVKIKEKHKKQMFFIKNVLDDFFTNKAFIDVDTSSLVVLIDEYFDTDEEIADSELVYIAHYIVNELLNGYDKKVELKSIECAFYKNTNRFEENETKEFFNLKRVFQNSIYEMKNSDNKRYKLSMLFGKVDILLNKIKARAINYPQKDFKLYSEHLNFIVEEFNQHDCRYKNKTLTTLLGNINELIGFIEIMRKYEKNSLLKKHLDISDEFDNLCNQYFFKFTYKIENITSYYLGWIDIYMWRRFFELKSFHDYRVEHFNYESPNTYNFLFLKGKIDKAKYEQFRPREYDNVVVLSNDVEKLTFFRDELSKKLTNYRFHIFTLSKMFEVWSEKNGVDRIIVDFGFRSNGLGNGLEFIEQLKKIESYFLPFYMQRIYLIVEDCKYNSFDLKDLKLHLIKKSDLKEKSIKDKLFHT